MKKMDQGRRNLVSVVLCIFFLVAFDSCAKIKRLDLLYTMKAEEALRIVRPISLEVNDLRENKQLLTERGLSDLGAFSSDIQLSVAPEGKKGFRYGLYELKDVFRIAFEERLSGYGIKVTPNSELRMVIDIEDFSVDLLKVSMVEKKWKAKIEYKASVYRGKTLLNSQNIRVDSEKLKIWKDTGMDALVSDAFSWAINSLDIKELFGKSY